MSSTVELVYQYRQLTGRCRTGQGVSLDDLSALLAIEARFAPGAGDEHFAGEPVALTAMLRSATLRDDVQIVSLSPAGCECRRAPYAEEGELMELVIDDAARALSYRFKARVAWLDDDGDDFALGLELVGIPLKVRYSPPSAAAQEDDDTAARAAA